MKKQMKSLLCLLLALVMLLSLAACDPQEQETQPSETDPTVPVIAGVADPVDDNYRTFYQVFVGSFSDSNGDGIGDLQGIINRMDYLNDGNLNSETSLGVQMHQMQTVFAACVLVQKPVQNVQNSIKPWVLHKSNPEVLIFRRCINSPYECGICS